MSLIRGAGMFLGNDSGPAHLAAAFNCPVAVIFGSSDPAVWAPWNTFSSEVLTSPTGITGVTEKQVFDALERLRLRVRP
jgi:ADP-heptose:LPS heptosyltransferase